MVRYVEIIDRENPKKPRGENIADELEVTISKIEVEKGVKLISACFIEQKIEYRNTCGKLEIDTVYFCYDLFFR